MCLGECRATRRKPFYYSRSEGRWTGVVKKGVVRMSEEKKTKAKAKTKKAGTRKTAKSETSRQKPSVVKKDSLVYVDYVARTKDDNEIFDLTLEDVARQEGIYRENARYEPVLVAVGHNWLLEAIEEGLIGMKVGETKTIEVPPERGAGHRDPKKIKLIPKTRLAKLGVKPIRGERVKMGNDEGVITNVTGRKVRVDFNSPLAGKTLVFDVTVRSIVTGTKDKIIAIVKRRIPAIPEGMLSVSKTKGAVTIELPEVSRYIEGIQYAEIGIASDIIKLMDDVKEVKIVTKFERRVPKETTEESEEGE